MDFVSIVTLLVIILDPFGLTPVLSSMLKGFSPKQRRKILIRELLFALLILTVFFLFGTTLMDFLKLKPVTLNISGGILLFLVAIGMVFPSLSLMGQPKEGKPEDLFIVPIAVPLIAGPSAIAVILLHSAQAQDMTNKLILGGALLFAWFLCSVILMISSDVMRLLGNRGAIALERLMGMLLILISIQMFLDGLDACNIDSNPAEIPAEGSFSATQ